MRIYTSYAYHAPIYLQIADYLDSVISSGGFPKGARLPPARELARVNEFNYQTAARAYRELVERGLIVSAPSTGTFACAPEDAEVAERTRGILDQLGRLARSFARLMLLDSAPARDYMLDSAEAQMRALLESLDEIIEQANDHSPYLRSENALMNAERNAMFLAHDPRASVGPDAYVPNHASKPPSQVIP